MIIVFAVVVLIVMDSSRLKEEQYNTKPIITIKSTMKESNILELENLANNFLD